nr:unnamed protein product [Digitaria exilis]
MVRGGEGDGSNEPHSRPRAVEGKLKSSSSRRRPRVGSSQRRIMVALSIPSVYKEAVASSTRIQPRCED